MTRDNFRLSFERTISGLDPFPAGPFLPMREIARKFEIDIMEGFGFLTVDVIGARALEAAPYLEWHRYVGTRHRNFRSHAERLAEFQSRLDAAKRRARR